MGDYYLANWNFSSSFHTDNYPGCHLGLELRWFCNGFSPRCGCRPEQHLQGFNFRFQHSYEIFFFQCGISVAPVTNWIYYDSIYTERWLNIFPYDHRKLCFCVSGTLACQPLRTTLLATRGAMSLPR